MKLKKYNLIVRIFLVAPSIAIWSALYIIVVIFSMKKCGKIMSLMGQSFIENADNEWHQGDKMPNL